MKYNNVKNYTDRQILERITGLTTFKGWPYGFFVVYIRSSEDAYNTFDDKKYTFYYDPKIKLRPEFVCVDTCTTNTGGFGLFNFSTYNRLGAAVLQSDHMVYDAFVRGFSRGRECYRENKAWGHYRDGNRNKKSEEIGKLYMTKIYAHIHGVASKYNIIRFIYNWSTACLVDNNTPGFKRWMKLLNGQKYLTAVILKEF